MSSLYKTISLKKHERPINNIKFSPNGDYLFSASSDRTVIKWDYKNCKNCEVYQHAASINVICITNSNKYMISGDSTGSIYVWDIEKNQIINKIVFDTLFNISSINLSSNDSFLIITFSNRGKSNFNSYVDIYATEEIIKNNENIKEVGNSSDKPNIYKHIKCPSEQTKYVKSCLFNFDKSILIGRQDGYLDMYDFENNNLLHSEKFHDDEILDLDTNDENEIILSSSKDGSISLINMKNFELVNKFKPTNPVRLINSCKIAIIENPYYNALGLNKEITKDSLFDLNMMDLSKLQFIENVEINEKFKKYKNIKNILLAIVAGGQDRKFVTTTEQKEGGFGIIIYNILTGEKMPEFGDHFGPINTLAVYKNTLASGGEDASVKVHDINHYIFS
jgi:WD40 repeat protein